MDAVLIYLLFLIVMMSLSWLSAMATVTYVIYRSHTPEQMIRLLLRDTYAMITVGVIMWLMLANVSWVLLWLILRAAILARVDWEQVCDKFVSIKKEISNSD